MIKKVQEEYDKMKSGKKGGGMEGREGGWREGREDRGRDVGIDGWK